MSRFDYEKIDVVEFLTGLGVQNVRDMGLEVSYSCPFEGHSRDDKNPSATMSKVTVIKNNGDEYPPTTFYCFACGRAGTAVTFLSEHEGVSPLIARQLLRREFGMSFKEPEGSLVDEIFGKISKEKERYPIEYEQPEIEENWFKFDWSKSVNSVQHSYMVQQRGFTESILNHFGVGWDNLSNRITIPLYDERNRLVGFKGRSLSGAIPKYLVLGGDGYSFDTCDVSFILFALPQAMESAKWQTTRELTLVEGELNAIAMHQKGYPNTVGISGQYLSDRQAAILRDSCLRVNLIFDDLDKAARATRMLERYMQVAVAPERDQDPADMSGDEVINMMNSLVVGYLI